jgi:hypothetical protein
MPKIEESQGAVAVATGSADNIPSELLKSQLLEGWRALKGVTVLHGFSYLAASQEAAGRVIAIVDGTFNRQVFKAVLEEAQKAGAKSEKVQVYCEIATYTGRGIDVTKFDDIGMSNLDRKRQSIDDLRAVVLGQIGNTEVFDACSTDEEKRQFVEEYMAEVMSSDESRKMLENEDAAMVDGRPSAAAEKLRVDHWEIRRRDGSLDSAGYAGRDQAKGALDELDSGASEPLSYYVENSKTGERIISFSGKTQLIMLDKSEADFFAELDREAGRPVNKEVTLDSLKADLEHAHLHLEGRLGDAQARLRSEFAPGSDVPEYRMAEGIRLRTQVDHLNWALEMLPGLWEPPVMRVQQRSAMPVESLSKSVHEARDLFQKRIVEVTSALAKGDLSLAQFPRVGEDALTELTASVAVLHQVLQTVPNPIKVEADLTLKAPSGGAAADVAKPLFLKPSGRFITDGEGRKVAEMLQPGDSPVEQEAIKGRMVRSFNVLPALVGVLLRADNEGALWQALHNEGITDAYDVALSEAVKALGDDGVATVAHRYELDPEVVRAKVEGSEQVSSSEPSPSPGM